MSHADRFRGSGAGQWILSAALAWFWALPVGAQVHYNPDGSPWNQRAGEGPDAEVDGWYYNLGLTGLRVELMAEAPRQLLVKHVFEGTPAAKQVRVGDRIVGAGGRPFTTEHRNGYGMEVFGPFLTSIYFYLYL